MGNYMETSSAEEFTYAEVVYAVYCYLYEFFLIFKELALRSETEKNPSVGTIKVFSNKSWQKLCTSEWDEADENLTCMAWATITTVSMLMAHGTQNVAMLPRCPPTTTVPFPPHVKTTRKRNNNFAKVIVNCTHVIST